MALEFDICHFTSAVISGSGSGDEAMNENGMHFDSFLVNHEFDLFVKLNTLNNISELNTRFSLIFAISVSDL